MSHITGRTSVKIWVTILIALGVSAFGLWSIVSAATPSAKPTGLQSADRSVGIKLTWNVPGIDGTVGYQILRRRPQMGENQLLEYVSNTNSTATTYTDTAVVDGVKYVYRVKAIDEDGNLSAWSNYTNRRYSVRATRPLGLQSVSGPAGVNLEWNAPTAGGTAGYQILRRRPQQGENQLLEYVSNTNSTAKTYTDTAVVDGVKYVYRVKAIDEDGNLSAWSNYTNQTYSAPTPTATPNPTPGPKGNEAPEITTSDTTASVPENSAAVLTLTATDVDATDTLSWSMETADDGSFFDLTQGGDLSFKNAPDFESKQDADTDNVYEVTVKVTDGDGLTDTHDLDVTVTNVNEAPEITTDSGVSSIFDVAENTATTEVIKTFEATDMDANSVLTWDLQGVDAGDFTITKNADGHGELKFSSVPNFERPVDAGTDNVYDFTVRVRDNGSPSEDDTIPVRVTVTDVNEAPVVSGDNSLDFAEIEYDATSADLTVGTYTYTDEDRNPADTVTWGLSGTDATHFDIGSASGVLSFDLRPDFENPLGADNDYEIVVEADDGQGGVGTFVVTVTVTNVDETPEITTTASSHTAPSFMENEYDATTADLVVADYDGRDEEGQTITWSRTGTDAGDFSIDTNSGVLSFSQRPNYEMPADDDGDNVYNVTVRASDTASPVNVRELEVAVTVTDATPTPGPNENEQQQEDTNSDATDTLPITPTGMSAVSSDDGMKLSWDAVNGNVLRYEVLRQRPRECEESLTVLVSDTQNKATSYTDDTVVAGVQYIYAVRAVNNAGAGPRSGGVVVRYVSSNDGTREGVPDAPTNLRTYVTRDGIEMEWQSAEDSTITGYQILRRVPSKCESKPRIHKEDTGSTETEALDGDVQKQVAYEYQVRAVNSNGVSPASNISSVTMSAVRTGMLVTRDEESVYETATSTMSVGLHHLVKDSDPDTVDYTFRGEVVSVDDGEKVNACAGEGLGTDQHIYTVDERVETLTATFGGKECTEGKYRVEMELLDADKAVVATVNVVYDVQVY